MTDKEYIEWLKKQRSSYAYYQYAMFDESGYKELKEEFISDCKNDFKIMFQQKQELPVIVKLKALLKNEIEFTLRMFSELELVRKDI